MRENGIAAKINLKDFLFMYIGTLLMSIALNVFFDPSGIVIGGATGIAVIFKYISESKFGFSIPLGVTNFVVNVPLFLFTLKIGGMKNIKKPLLATLMLSLNLIITRVLPQFRGDFILIVVFGGVITGTGIALIFRAGATTGGSDMAASLLQMKFKQYTVANIMFVIDVVIISFGYFVFGAEVTLYSVITVFIISKIIDAFLEGLSFSKAAFIISANPQKISEAIIKRLHRGVTSLYGKGMYSGNEKNVLFCVVAKKEIIIVKEIVREFDSEAFVILADVREVLGEGFQSIK